jgi:dihydromethanopterin reductase (acceptor)
MSEALEEQEEKPREPRLAWALTGSGHDFAACLELIRRLGAMDVFLSRAAAEVIFMYTRDRSPFPPEIRLIRDSSASAAPVGRFYHGWYHTLVVAPATSNTVAKCVAGISDTLVTNVLAQAGKCRVPVIVYACDTAPVHDTMAPDRLVRLWPRRIDLDNTERLKAFEATTVVEDMAGLEAAVTARLAEVTAGRPGR